MININRDTIATYACTQIANDTRDSLESFDDRDAYIDASLAELRDDLDSFALTFIPSTASNDATDNALELMTSILDAEYDFIRAAMIATYDNMIDLLAIYDRS